jgi:hypothetical protein
MDIPRRGFVIVLFLSCLACASVRPTPGMASMAGYVFDQTGMPLSGVTIEARLHWWEDARRTHTNQEGRFSLTGLAPGRYRVEASARGLNPVVHVDVPVPTTVGREVQLMMEVKSRNESGHAVEAGAGPLPFPPPASGGRGQTLSRDSVLGCVSGARPSPTTRGSVSGFVLDQTRSRLMNVTVEVRSMPKGRARWAFTDATGFFWILGLKPGRYRVRSSVPGFSAAVQQDVRVRAQRSAEVTLILELRFTDENSFVVKQTPGPNITRPNIPEAYSRS